MKGVKQASSRAGKTAMGRKGLKVGKSANAKHPVSPRGAAVVKTKSG